MPLVNKLFVMQSGLIWQYQFGLIPLLFVLAVILVTVPFTAYLAALRVKKMQPITALRQGAPPHNFKRNPMPLHKGKRSPVFLLSMKAALQNTKQNISIFIIVAVLSFACVFMSVMLQAFVFDFDATSSFFVGEQADASVYTPVEGEREVYDYIKARPEVERSYRYQTAKVLLNGEQLITYLVDDAKELTNPEICSDGRLPKHNNGIALGGLMAKNHNIKIGDEITLQQEANSANYIVTGFIQNSNYMGKDSLMLTAGYDRVKSAEINGSIYIHLKEGYDIDTFLESVSGDETVSENIVVAINIRKVIEGALSSLTMVVALMVIVFMVIIFAIIALSLYLIGKTYLLRRKKDYGIQKAIGYTTRQLVLQTALGFMPVVIIGAIVGFGIGIFAINPLLTVLFGGIGIMKAMFIIPVGFTTTFAAAIVLFAFVVSCLVSLRVRKITPRELIAG